MLASLLLVGNAYAQECPAGLAGLPGCLPPNHPASPLGQGSGSHGSSGGDPFLDGAVFEHRYGALAVSDKVDMMGVSAGAHSPRKARKAAIEDCEKRGGIECGVRREFVDDWFAVASGTDAEGGYYVAAIGFGDQDAQAQVLAKCAANGLTECKVEQVVDNHMERVR